MGHRLTFVALASCICKIKFLAEDFDSDLDTFGALLGNYLSLLSVPLMAQSYLG